MRQHALIPFRRQQELESVPGGFKDFQHLLFQF